MLTRSWLLSLVVCGIVTVVAAPPTVAETITYELVPIRNPGNGNDTGGTGNGAVAYEYQIGKYATTIGQYTAFLNAVAQTDTYALYNDSMATDFNVAGILQSGSSGSYTYSTITNGGDSASRPITYVSWWDAARFANWMANGQPTGGQGPTTTENGAYNVNGSTSGSAVAINATNPNTGAAPTFFIPGEDEWYKAAYYNPTLNSGSGGYYAYATLSDTAPGNVSGSSANQANYIASSDVFSVTQSGTYDSSQNYLTDVGAFSGSGTFYGTFDQSGNVFQWNDLDGTPGSSRGLRGGSWNNGDPTNGAVYLSSSYSLTADPSDENSLVGFRLASPIAVPEPSTWAMAFTAAGIGLMALRRPQA
jgi:sulfatase modifying factor 1